MHLDPTEIVFLIYLIIFAAIQYVILLGYFDLRRKYKALKDKVEKLEAEIDSNKK